MNPIDPPPTGPAGQRPGQGSPSAARGAPPRPNPPPPAAAAGQAAETRAGTPAASPGWWGPPWWRSRRSPPWWPEGEPWPPAGPRGGEHWRGMRGMFFRRMGCGFAILLFAALGLFSALFWLLSSSLNLVNLSESFQNTLRLALLGFLALALVGIIIGGAVMRRMAAPVGSLLDAAGRIADGDYAARVPEHGPGEVRGLARAFNSMAERLEANDRQRRALLADVTHELRTPITIIQGNLEGMLDGIYPADPDHLHSLLDETHVLSRIIEDLRTLSLAEAGALRLQTETADLGSLVREAAAAFQPQALRSQVALLAQAAPDLPAVEVDPTRIREVIANLLSNALRYSPPGSEVRVAAERKDNAGGQLVLVSVQDSGPGIAPADLPHIFDRFYKSADSRGSGLGLAIARSLVTAHGGEITAESEPGRGTKITFWLPGVE